MKIKRTLSIIALSFTTIILSAQIGPEGVSIAPSVVSPDPSAMLDVQSEDKGILIPRVSLMSNVDITTVPNPVKSLMVFNDNPSMINGAEGYYYWDGAKWVSLGGSQTMPKVTFNEMIAMEANLTDDDRGFFVFVTDATYTFPCEGGLSLSVYGVWYFLDTTSCYGKWIRLIDGRLSQPCPESFENCGSGPSFDG